MRPVDDDLVGAREAGAGGEDGAGVAHRDVVAEERADLGHGGCEVDGSEDQHPRLGGEAPDEDAHPLAAPLAVGAVGQRGVGAGREQAQRVVVHGRVGPLGPEAALGRDVRPDDHPPPDPLRVRVLDDGHQRDRAAGLDVGGHLAELREGGARDLLDEDVEDAAAGQADGEGVVVGDAVALEHGLAGGDDGLGQLVDGALDAAARHRADGGLVGADEHRRARRARRGAEGGDDGADADRLAGLPPLHQLGQHVTHGRSPRSARRRSPASGRRGSRRSAAARPRHRPAAARSRPSRGAG